MKAPAQSTLEPLLRQIVPQLCTLAATCNPELAEALEQLQ